MPLLLVAGVAALLPLAFLLRWPVATRCLVAGAYGTELAVTALVCPGWQVL